MEIEIHPKSQTKNDWHTAFGLSREDIVSTITGNGWMGSWAKNWMCMKKIFFC